MTILIDWALDPKKMRFVCTECKMPNGTFMAMDLNVPLALEDLIDKVNQHIENVHEG